MSNDANEHKGERLIRVGTRKSPLAMVQTELIIERIKRNYPQQLFEIVPIITEGDKNLDISLDKMGGKGVFISELENKLLSGQIDMAIHSAKDMPMNIPEGLTLAAVSSRADARDVIVYSSADFEKGIIGTSSLRREIQARRIWPESTIESVRGNVHTRLNKLASGHYDALILASAGLTRLGLINEKLDTGIIEVDNKPLNYRKLSFDEMLPAAGQGFMAIETRQNDKPLIEFLQKNVSDIGAEICLACERAFISFFDAGCNAPLAVMAEYDQQSLKAKSLLAGNEKNSFCKDQIRLTVLDCRPAQKIALETVVDNPFAATRFDFLIKVSENIPQQNQEEDSEPNATKDRIKKIIEEIIQKTKKYAEDLPQGQVSLVGAGPGRRELMTLKGAQKLAQADVVVYDRLAAPSLLGMAKAGAHLIYVGKSAGQHTLPQEQINQLLVRLSRQGLKVVRLKGGDPFVFGRGGEEAMALRQAGQSFEIVPGISSAVAVPLYAGIPVTHRGVANSFHIITGQDKTDSNALNLDFAVLAKVKGTLICLMGLRTLPQLAAGLIKAGMNPATPAATISQGTTGSQKIIKCRLSELAAEVEKANIPTPALTVIGDVVNLSSDLDWLKKGLLAGKKILVTRTKTADKPTRLGSLIEAMDGEAIEISLIEIIEIIDSKAVKEAISELAGGKVDRLILTSENGVKAFIKAFQAAKIDIRSIGDCKIAVVGASTALALSSHGLQADFIPSVYTSECLAAELVPQIDRRERVILFGAASSSETIADSLSSKGISYRKVDAYITKPNSTQNQALIQLVEQVDAMTFASGSAVKAFADSLQDIPDDEREIILKKLPYIYSIGPVTTAACEKEGFDVRKTAEKASAEALLESMLDDLLQSK